MEQIAKLSKESSETAWEKKATSLNSELNIFYSHRLLPACTETAKSIINSSKQTVIFM